jgi:hypothetical protein
MWRLYLLTGVSMKNEDRTLINIHEKAEEAGIEMPVVIDPNLLKELTPTPYLYSFGVSLEKRIENLFGLVKGNLTREVMNQPETSYYLPFIVLKGPMVCEDFLPIIATVNTKEGRSSITLSQAVDDKTE